MSEDVIEIRKDKIISFFKGKSWWVIILLIIALILGIYIRSMPLQDHNGRPGLWDIAKNDYTLGPDLDPWLFTRYAQTIVEQGGLPKIDVMRNVPLGFDTTIETQLHPYLIVLTHKVINIFTDVSVVYSAAVFPVIMFALTIIAFFLFVREIFVRKSKKSIMKANIISLIATFFMIVIPVFLSRTIAGIPEKESSAFFFLFLSLFLFLKAWKSKKPINYIILSILAGIFTAMTGLIWGGVIYVFISIGGASFLAFLLNKVKKKEFTIYSLWIIISIALMIIFSNRNSLRGMLTSLDSGLAFLFFFIFLIDFLLWNTKLANIRLLENRKLPKNIISLIIGIILLVILVSVAFGPVFIIDKVKVIHETIFQAVVGRWGTTVAENRQPYFVEWSGSFGPYLKGIPILFWMFFIGSIVLFKKMLRPIKNKDSWILTLLFLFFLSGLIFSRYSPSHIFNGVNFISIAFYYSSVALLLGSLIYYYVKYYKAEDKGFERINYEYLLLLVLFALTLFTARGAVRLIMVLGPIGPIFVGFLIVESTDRFFRIKDETGKVILGAIVIIILILSIFSFYTFYGQIKGQAFGFIPGSYHQQWQKGMQWVRDTTPEDAVFAHWWDYGYWVQSIGERATVLDGGNAITYWNYLMGRLVLTGDNEKDALEFLYNHDATHLLIDSTDIGKYGAFSSIGSDADYDRLSFIATFQLDESQTRETNNQTMLFYSGGAGLDEDMILRTDSGDILLPRGQAGVGGIVIPTTISNDTTQFGQPYVIIVYQNQQQRVNIRYLSIGGQFIDFGSGTDREKAAEAAIFVFPRITQTGQGIQTNPIGTAMYLSPRLFRGMLAQKYILEDPLNNFPHFKLAYTQPSPVVESLNSQGAGLPDFVYFNGIQGPIKIWEIEYTGEEQKKEEYIDRDYTKYIDWVL